MTTQSNTTTTLIWTSADGQSSMDMGQIDTTRLEAEIELATAELLAQCTTDEEREGILAGKWDTRRL